MRMSRAVLLGVAAWLAVVAVGSTAVWLVISSAGENVGTAEDAPSQAAATLAGRPATPRVSPSTANPPAYPPARRQTWQGLGGQFTAQCRGHDIGYVAAQPDTGFAVEVGDDGPVTLEVHFTGREDSSGARSEVKARCVGGVPSFESRSEGSSGGDE